jgi:DNA-binding winged helix-turn-helix (wHTH) protein
MSETERKLFEFEGFTLDTMRGCLRAGDREIALRPKSFELLRHLAENAGRLISKDELVGAIWPKVFVSDDSLARCVSDVRLALDDDDHKIIKTVRGRGYLLAPRICVSGLGPAMSPADEANVTEGNAAAPSSGLPNPDGHFVPQIVSPSGVAFAGRAFAISNIPIGVPMHFMGRDDALASIVAALDRVAMTALHGLRGVGKTTLAATYAEHHRGEYRATWWIRAQTQPSMRADIAALGVRLGWVGAADKEDPALATVIERLRYEGEGILLIYDNAIDANALKPYLPRGGIARVLITSNAHAWRGVAEPIEIRLWPKEIGADYLTARTGRCGERAAAEALSEALGGLPLAHEQAAAYCERLEISLGEYRKRFEAAPGRLLDDACHAPAEYHDGLTVAKTFRLAIEEAAKLSPAAEPLIVHAALLAPEPIPLFLSNGIQRWMTAARVSLVTGKGFFWAKTIKVPYLDRAEAQRLLTELDKVLSPS